MFNSYNNKDTEPKELEKDSGKKLFYKLSFIMPAMILLILLTGYPLIQVIKMSFYNYENYGNPIFAGFQNYKLFLKDPLFWNAVVNTLFFTAISVIIGFILGLILALLLNQSINSKIKGIFRSILMFPWLFSSTVVAAIWMLILNPFGLLNWLLKMIGLTSLADIAWLGDERFALLGVTIANIWRGFPFMMLMLLAGLQTIQNDLYEAAEIDGAGFFKKLIYITLPQLKPIILTVITLEIIWNFRSFDLVFLMTGGGPMDSTEILSTYVYQHAFRSLDFGYASAAAIFMLIIMILISIIYLKASIKKEGE